MVSETWPQLSVGSWYSKLPLIPEQALRAGADEH